MSIFFFNRHIKWVSILVVCTLLFTSIGVAFASSVPVTFQGTSSKVETAVGIWETVSSPTTNNLGSLSFSSRMSGWAGGDNILLRYNGTAWQTFTVPELGTDFRIDDISMISDADGWFVGNARRTKPYYESIIFHWDGSQWNEITPPTAFALMAVSAVDSDHVYTSGGGALCSPTCNDLLGWAFLWNGSSWTNTPIGSHQRVTDVSMVDNSDGWMVGDAVDTSTNQYRALTMRWVSGNWQSVSVPNIFNNRLYSVSTLDANQAWAIGLFDTLMWNGSNWKVVPNQTSHGLRDVLAMAMNDAWVVGELGTILHWNGSSFVVSSNPATDYLNKIAKAADYDIWVVGNGGIILNYKQANFAINHNNGAPGSFFNLTASNFPPSQPAVISVNGHVLQTTSTDSEGFLTVTLSTPGIEPGTYIVSITVDSTQAMLNFRIDNAQPSWDQEGSFPVYVVPSGIGYAYSIFIP